MKFELILFIKAGGLLIKIYFCSGPPEEGAPKILMETSNTNT